MPSRLLGLIILLFVVSSGCQKSHKNQNDQLNNTMWWGGYRYVISEDGSPWSDDNQLYLRFEKDSMYLSSLSLPRNRSLSPHGQYSYEYKGGGIYLNESDLPSIEIRSLSSDSLVFSLVESPGIQYTVPKGIYSEQELGLDVSDYLVENRNVLAILKGDISDSLRLVFGKDTFFNSEEKYHAYNEWDVVAKDGQQFLVLDLLPWAIKAVQLDSFVSNILYGTCLCGKRQVTLMFKPSSPKTGV